LEEPLASIKRFTDEPTWNRTLIFTRFLDDLAGRLVINAECADLAHT